MIGLYIPPQRHAQMRMEFPDRPEVRRAYQKRKAHGAESNGRRQVAHELLRWKGLFAAAPIPVYVRNARAANTGKGDGQPMFESLALHPPFRTADCCPSSHIGPSRSGSGMNHGRQANDGLVEPLAQSK